MTNLLNWKMKFELSKPETIRHLILLGIGWFVFSVMVGLFQTFDLLEASMETNQVSAIFEGLKISSITFVTGVIVISSVYVIFHSIKKGAELPLIFLFINKIIQSLYA